MGLNVLKAKTKSEIFWTYFREKFNIPDFVGISIIMIFLIIFTPVKGFTFIMILAFILAGYVVRFYLGWRDHLLDLKARQMKNAMRRLEDQVYGLLNR